MCSNLGWLEDVLKVPRDFWDISKTQTSFTDLLTQSLSRLIIRVENRCEEVRKKMLERISSENFPTGIARTSPPMDLNPRCLLGLTVWVWVRECGDRHNKGCEIACNRWGAERDRYCLESYECEIKQCYYGIEIRIMMALKWKNGVDMKLE